MALVDSEFECADRQGKRGPHTFALAPVLFFPPLHQCFEFSFPRIHDLLGRIGLGDPGGRPGLAGIGICASLLDIIPLSLLASDLERVERVWHVVAILVSGSVKP